MIGNDIQRTGNWECGNRRATCQRLELHNAECVRQTWKNKDVSRGQMRAEFATGLFAQKLDFRVPTF